MTDPTTPPPDHAPDAGEATAKRLADIRARVDAASPGPWANDDPSWKEVNDITVWGNKGSDEEWCVCNMGAPMAQVSDLEEAEVSWANGEFVAHSREDIPWLLARVAKLESENARLRVSLTQYADERHWEYDAKEACCWICSEYGPGSMNARAALAPAKETP